MWLNNGQRFWEKESSFSRNGTRQSDIGEPTAAIEEQISPVTLAQHQR